MKLSARLTQSMDSPAPADEDAPLDRAPYTVRATVPHCLAILAIPISIIHFAVAGQQFQQLWLFGVVTLIAAWLQLLWALAVVVQPSQILWWRVGAILNAGVIVIDIGMRMAGAAGGFGVAAGVVFAALVVVGCTWLLVGRRDYGIGREGLVATYGTVGIVTATVLSISLIAGGPAPVKPAAASAPAVDRHGLQANVPLPGGVSFAGVRQTSRVPDPQYHSNISIDTWGWTVRGTGAIPLQKFYARRLPKLGWGYVRWESAMGGYGNAQHLTACHSGQVLLVSSSGSKLEALDTTTGKVTASVTAPQGGSALMIQLDNSPGVAQVACPRNR